MFAKQILETYLERHFRCGPVSRKQLFSNKNTSFSQACVLMNNIQQTRIQLEKTYQSMGGQELEEDAASVLNQLQSKLNKDLDELAKIFAIR